MKAQRPCVGVGTKCGLAQWTRPEVFAENVRGQPPAWPARVPSEGPEHLNSREVTWGKRACQWPSRPSTPRHQFMAERRDEPWVGSYVPRNDTSIQHSGNSRTVQTSLFLFFHEILRTVGFSFWLWKRDTCFWWQWESKYCRLPASPMQMALWVSHPVYLATKITVGSSRGNPQALTPDCPDVNAVLPSNCPTLDKFPTLSASVSSAAKWGSWVPTWKVVVKTR